jgi:hypothetical protein
MPETDKTASPSRSPFRQPQFRWKTDPTFYPTARLAMESPQERYAYVTAIAPDHNSRTDSVLASVLQIGGIARRTPHPSQPGIALNGAPQMVELSRDGKRLYFTNSLYAAWDEQFYPDGIGTWFVRAEANQDGSLKFDRDFFVTSESHRFHQVRLDGGDTSSDSFCYPS